LRGKIYEPLEGKDKETYGEEQRFDDVLAYLDPLFNATIAGGAMRPSSLKRTGGHLPEQIGHLTVWEQGTLITVPIRNEAIKSETTDLWCIVRVITK